MVKLTDSLPVGWRRKADGTLVIPDGDLSSLCVVHRAIIARAVHIETSSGRVLKSRNAEVA